MVSSRKIVLILGYGFDLDLGLKTSYKDFWESGLCPKEYPAPIIHHLNQCWPGALDAVKWYDLENELINYYRILQTGRRLPDIITSDERRFIEAVSPATLAFSIPGQFLQQAQALFEKGVLKETFNPVRQYVIPYHEDLLKSTVWRDQKALRLIKEKLCEYLKGIKHTSEENRTIAFHVLLSMLKSADKEEVVNIYTFNYTKVLCYGHSIADSMVHYMHGSCNGGRIIIGTRDDLEMNSDYDFLQKGMDPYFNPPDLVTALKEADEVIIFGHSLGENDRQYFAPFFKKQADVDDPSKKSITIFTRDHNSQIEIKRALQKMTEGNLSALFSINQPVIIKTGCILEDKQLLYDFLAKHHFNKDHIEELIGKLINAQQST